MSETSFDEVWDPKRFFIRAGLAECDYALTSKQMRRRRNEFATGKLVRFVGTAARRIVSCGRLKCRFQCLSLLPKMRAIERFDGTAFINMKDGIELSA